MDARQNLEQDSARLNAETMTIGIAADHGGFKLKEELIAVLKNQGYKIIDFGAYEFISDDDYPEFIIPMAKAVKNKEVYRDFAICGSGVGACVAANKVAGVRAALIADSFSAHQGVEDDDMNVMCLGGQITGYNLACELVLTFLSARFKGEERFTRRLAKIEALENENNP